MLTYWKSAYGTWIDYPQRVGKVLQNRYRIERFLGMGSYGLTYLCRELASSREIVLKQAKPSKGLLGQQLLQREMEIMGQLDHPSIPKCVSSFRAGKRRLFMITEYVSGQTIEDLIFEQGVVFGEKEALGFIRRLMDIVQYLHEQGIVHLDIRIPNVILQGERIHLIDFGLASRLGEPGFAEIGVDEEQRKRKTVNVISDLYAIGHFLLFMLYSAYVPETVSANDAVGWEEELQLSVQTKQLIRKLLQIDPAYGDAQALISDLDAALRQ
ncbi:protein kinase [Paenibacillus sp. HWE-109]|uniref:serine/threonine protein kinase n=1 Tax=Paenibacillus sp. HWE-109 TaxID=1306526 RepID=UPI001EE02F90|nr:protein kinase [Paenibacillus sp. HWE-109]UKS30915.1 protein kinase [Paenibacillus sp. HWE-109]